MEKLRVLMIGPDRLMKGGVSTVVNNYYDVGIENYVDLPYISTVLDGNKFQKLWMAVKSYIVFSKVYRHYDILHVHMAANASFIRKAFFVKKAYKAGMKIIIQEHGGDFNSFYDKLDDGERVLVAEVFSMASKLIVLSEEWKEFFSNGICAPEKIVVLHNGVIVPEKQITLYHSHKVIYLGRLCKEKGIYDLLQAIPAVIEVIPDAQFVLCGDGELEQVKSEAARLGVTKAIKLLGWVRGEKKEKILSTCETLVLPSYYEGMPMVVLEAMSYGYSVIASNVGGTPHIIKDGVNGILINPGDVVALSTHLIRVLSDDKLREQYGKAARKTIEEGFDLNNSVKFLYDTYQEVETNEYKTDSSKISRGNGQPSTLRLLMMMQKN